VSDGERAKRMSEIAAPRHGEELRGAAKALEFEET
jgi:hypothetical protein